MRHREAEGYRDGSRERENEMEREGREGGRIYQVREGRLRG